MKRFVLILMVLAFGAFLASGAGAATTGLREWEILGGGVVNSAVFNTTTGLGTITVTVSGAGAYNVRSFFDHDIDDTINGFFNEFGAINGTPASGKSWEIDEPTLATSGYMGDIYWNFVDGTLDNTIFGGTFTGPEDVSMAMGWEYSLLSYQTATVTFALGTTAPTSGFYLVQTDPDSQASIYLNSSLLIEGKPPIPGVPEPATLILLGLGLAGLIGGKKKLA